jgi:hypothetical protein
MSGPPPSHEDDARRFAPATQRNREPILGVLRKVLPPSGVVLEVASGTGEHAVYFAPAFPRLTWQPSDCGSGERASIAAWIAHAGVANVRAPLALDASAASWPIEHADAVVCVNMIHIAPWAACVGLVGGAAAVLPAGAPLVLYGPFRRDGGHTTPSNEAFDRALRAQNPTWGVRDLEAVAAVAAAHGFGAPAIFPLPSNNLGVVFSRA